MAPHTGFEPVTSCLTGNRSNQAELIGHSKLWIITYSGWKALKAGRRMNAGYINNTTFILHFLTFLLLKCFLQSVNLFAKTTMAERSKTYNSGIVGWFSKESPFNFITTIMGCLHFLQRGILACTSLIRFSFNFWNSLFISIMLYFFTKFINCRLHYRNLITKTTGKFVLPFYNFFKQRFNFIINIHDLIIISPNLPFA